MQIGYMTQFGLLCVFVGIVLLTRTEGMAKWHANDEKTQRRLHERAQKHHKKSKRTEYVKPDEITPGKGYIAAFKVLGILLTVAGVVLIIKSTIL